MQALAQQQADFQQSVRCWQRRLHLQAADPVVFCIELQAANMSNEDWNGPWIV